MSIFEELDYYDREIKEKKKKKSYPLCLSNRLFNNGHFKEMKDAASTFIVLTDKCTCEVISKGQIYYLVYGGEYSRTIISELAEIRGKSRSSIWRDLEYLKARGKIDFETKGGLGTRIALKPIPGGFERTFKKRKELGQSNLSKNERVPTSECTRHLYQNGRDLYQNDIGENSVGKETAKENKENSETAKNRSALTITSTIQEESTTTKTTTVVEIRSILGKTASLKTIEELIQGKDPQTMVELAKYAREHAHSNPVGYFRRLVEGGTEPLEYKPKLELTGRISFDCTPDAVLDMVEKEFPNASEDEKERILAKILDRYHVEYEPRDFHKYKSQLEKSEVENLITAARKVIEELKYR